MNQLYKILPFARKQNCMNFKIWLSFPFKDHRVFPPENLLSLLLGALGQSTRDPQCFCIKKMLKVTKIQRQVQGRRNWCTIPCAQVQCVNYKPSLIYS